MPTQIIDGFSLNAARPIDSRMVTSGTVSRNNMSYRYVGLRVYDTAQNQAFVWDGTKWADESGGGQLKITDSKPNYISKFTATGLTNSIIREATVGADRRIGINLADNVTLTSTLQVGGTVCASTFCGSINGNNLVNATVALGKITPPGTAGILVLKSEDNTLKWLPETVGAGGGGSATMNNNTTSTGSFLTFVDSTTSTSFYTSCTDPNKVIGADLSTSQLTLSNSNGSSAPPYSFIGNKNTGLYGGTTEVGISMAGNRRVYANSAATIIGVGSSPIINAGASCIGMCANTCVFGYVNSNSLTTTGDGVIGGQLTVSGNTTINACLNVSNTTTLTNLCVTGTSNIAGLALSSLNISNSTTFGGSITNTNASGCGLVVRHTGCGLILKQDGATENFNNKIIFTKSDDGIRGSIGYDTETNPHIRVKNGNAVFSFQNDGRFKTTNLQLSNSMVFRGIYAATLRMNTNQQLQTTLFPYTFDSFFEQMTPVGPHDVNATFANKLLNPNGSRWLFEPPVQRSGRLSLMNYVYRIRVWHYLGDRNYTATATPQYMTADSISYDDYGRMSFVTIEKPIKVDNTGEYSTTGTNDYSNKYFDIIVYKMFSVTIDLNVMHYASYSDNEK